MDKQIEKKIAEKLRFLYNSTEPLEGIRRIIEEYPIPPRGDTTGTNQPILIAYGDHVQAAGSPPLDVLGSFANDRLRGLVGGVHILPFYPYTSDDGFSVVDYLRVDPALGDWPNVRKLGEHFQLMFDLVLNHASVSSEWFQAFLRDEAPYNDYFVTESPDTDLSAVVRPRTHPLLTPFETAAGTRYVWTTFSTDQVDLNFANPAVLQEIIKTLLFYVQQGADVVRMDAIAYLWKIPGTSCIHLPQTHRVVQLLRDVLDAAAPWVKIISETNVPHVENLSYFGDGQNEAQMVYQFALPPLLLHTFYSGDAGILSDWAASLQTPSSATTFFNFTASHDGIGVRPATGLIPDASIEQMLEGVTARGGQISYKSNSDGSKSAYEMNITYFDALVTHGETLAKSVDRFIASQAIMLALAGVPGIYLGSLFGAANWQGGVRQTGRARSINREKFDLAELEARLNDLTTREGQVFQRYSQLLRVRYSQKAFDPQMPQRVLDLHPAVFALERGDLLALHHIADQSLELALPDGLWHDLISDRTVSGAVILNPYQILWLVPERKT